MKNNQHQQSVETLSLSGNGDSSDYIKCPIGDIGIHRRRIKQHLKACMAGTIPMIVRMSQYPHKINKPPAFENSGLLIEISIFGDRLADVLPSWNSPAYRFPFFCRSISRNSTRRILPEMVLGRLSTNSISRGYLYGAVTRFTCSCSSLASSGEAV